MHPLDQGREGLPAAVRRVATVLALCAAVALCCATTDCYKRPDCYGIDPGDQVAITVVSVYDKGIYSGSNPCGFGSNITQGLVLDTTDVSNPDSRQMVGSCNSALVRLAPFNGWTWTPVGVAQASEPTVLMGKFNGTNGTCSGYATIQVFLTSDEDDQPFDPSDAGPFPPILMQYTLGVESGDAGCPLGCNDYYAVDLARL